MPKTARKVGLMRRYATADGDESVPGCWRKQLLHYPLYCASLRGVIDIDSYHRFNVSIWSEYVVFGEAGGRDSKGVANKYGRLLLRHSSL